MGLLFTKILVLMSLMSFPSWGLTMDDLVKRGGLYYEKFTDVPFTGELTKGTHIGFMENGKPEGFWVKYFDDGTLHYKGHFKNGVTEGCWTEYHKNGQLMAKGRYIAGKKDGLWKAFNSDGSVDVWLGGRFKNGERATRASKFTIDDTGKVDCYK